MKLDKLTPQLLGLVLGEAYMSRLHEWHEIIDNNLTTYYDCGSFDDKGRPTGLGMEINLDTLTRMMKEWIIEQGYDVITLSIDGWSGIKLEINRLEKYNEGNYEELEAALEATLWVATELKLLGDE